jgi:hypothetical protein
LASGSNDKSVIVSQLPDIFLWVYYAIVISYNYW